MEKVGPTNGVVFLREAEGDYGVGAYVNYEWQDRNILPTLELLGSAVCPQMQEDPGLLKFDDASDFAQCEGADAGRGLVAAESDPVRLACDHREVGDA